jgi:cell division protease FtsH
MNWFLYGGIALMIFAVAWYWFRPPTQVVDPLKWHDRAPFARIQELVDKEPAKVKGITFLKEQLRDTPVKVVLDGEESLWADIPGTYDYQLLSEQAEKRGVRKDAKPLHPETELQGPSDGLSFASLVGNVLVPLVIMGMVFFMFRKANGAMGMGEKHGQITLARLDQLEKKVKFEDVAGIEDELGRIRSIVFDIQQPWFIERLGGNVPAGLLLKGPPGTGKTYLVQAIAGETGLPVLTCSGGDFVDKYVGVGASRVRDAFAKVRALRDEMDSWVVFFIDEFDAVGKRRGGAGGGNDERDQTVGQLLVELQGSQSDNSRILVVVATNQPENLDPALTRRGRLGDLQIEISPPDRAGRLAILSVKIKKVPAAPDVDLSAIADEMTGLTGADIDTLVTKQAPAFAKKRMLDRMPGGLLSQDTFKPEEFKILHEDLWKALEDMIMGTITETKGRRLDPDVKRMIAYHELGHFIVAYRKFLQNSGKWDGQYGDVISAISILGPSGIGGFVRTTSAHDFKTAKNLKSRIAIALAGNRSERMLLGDTTGGCQNDLQQAMRIIKAMLLSINMSDCNNKGWKLPAISVDYQGGSQYLGGQATHAPQYGMSDFSASQVDDFIALFLAEGEAEADAYLREEEGFIHWMVPQLIKAERMRLPQIKACWDQFHQGKDLSRAVAFPYAWDENHKGMTLVPAITLSHPDSTIAGTVKK